MQDELQQLIEITAGSTSLASTVIEKDFYVTKAIHALASLQHNYFNLIFQGGAALAKAHRLIHRMSEDCDFHIQCTDEAKKLNSSQKKSALKKYRQDIIGLLIKEGLTLIEDGATIQDSGNYILLQLQYPSLYGQNTHLRPHIQIELMLNEAKLPVVQKEVTTLIRQILGDEVNHPIKNINCVSINETAAEKWVALTRRIASGIRNPDSYIDHTLVRHIYDLYCINKFSTLG